MSGKQARRRRRENGGPGRAKDPALSAKLGEARTVRDRRLGQLAVEMRDLERQLLDEWARRRREIWVDYDEQRQRIVENHRPATAA